jgi:hypothetical protein
MFNISKGPLSLHVFCGPAEVQIKKAPGDKSHPGLVKSIIQSETALAKSYLRMIKEDYPELTLMDYFAGKGYTVTKLSPKLKENELGQMSVSFW